MILSANSEAAAVDSRSFVAEAVAAENGIWLLGSVSETASGKPSNPRRE